MSEVRIGERGNVRRSVRYWPGVGKLQNFGDFLTELLLDELFLPLAVRSEGIQLIGSTIDDMFFPPPRESGGPVAPGERFIFWGCGMRSETGLSDRNHARSEFLAVRGPLTRSALRLGESVPLGDPAFLVPALHERSTDSDTAGRTLCVPHFLDQRSDSELLTLSRCDALIRTGLPASKQALRQFIDKISSAEFVLTAALHGAAIAAAYERPFAFWDNGHVDLPFKWADLAALLCIENVFASDLEKGRALYEERIARALTLPRLWPLLAAAPLAIKPEAALKVLRYEHRRNAHVAEDIAQKTRQWLEIQQKTTDLSGYALTSFSQHWTESAISSLGNEVTALSTDSERLRVSIQERHGEVERLKNEADIRRTELVNVAEQLERVKNEADIRRTELAAVAEQLERSAQEIEETTDVIHARDSAIEHLSFELKAATMQVATLQERLRQNELTSKRTPLTKVTETLNGALERLARLRKAERPLSILKQRAVILLETTVPQKARNILRRGIGKALARRDDDTTRFHSQLASSPLFDASWYATQYPDVASAAVDPINHYIQFGAAEGRDPSAIFSTRWYLTANPDVHAANVNPLVHYLSHGYHEGRRPNPNFDPRWYLATHPDVASAGREPLGHYIKHGAIEGRRPAADFDALRYGQEHTDAGTDGAKPFLHFLGLAFGERSVAPQIQAEPNSQAPRRATRELPKRVANRRGPRLLIIDSVYPKPDRDSGSVTARHLVDIFLGLGWQVTFYADAEAGVRSPYADDLTQAGVRCLSLSQILTLDAFLEQEGLSFSLCILFRVHSGGRHYELVRRHCQNAKIVFETVDLHYLREERQARLLNDRRALNAAFETRERELYVARSSDLTIVVSEFERELLNREIPGTQLLTLPLILDCPGRQKPFSARSGICFVGGYLHAPNVDAVEYFVAEIWPLIVAEEPSCTFSIIGADLPQKLKRLESRSVRAVGYVKDLDSFLSSVRLTVAPLRYGAGIKGKIGSSLASGVPCVATPIAIEGMGLATGETIALASEPVEFARLVVALLRDEVAWTRMSDAGWRYAAEHYSLAAARERVAAMLTGLKLPNPRRLTRNTSATELSGTGRRSSTE